MYPKVLVLLLISFFQHIRAVEELKTNQTNVVQLESSTCESKVHTAFNASRWCSSTEKLKQLDINRCTLITSIIENVCKAYPNFDVHNYTKPIATLCEQKFRVHPIVPPIFSFLLSSWKVLCNNICIDSKSHVLVPCTFILRYYTDLDLENSNKTISVAQKVQLAGGTDLDLGNSNKKISGAQKVQLAGGPVSEMKVTDDNNNEDENGVAYENIKNEELPSKVSDDGEHESIPNENPNPPINENSNLAKNSNLPNVEDIVEDSIVVKKPSVSENEPSKLEPVFPDGSENQEHKIDDVPRDNSNGLSSSSRSDMRYSMTKIDDEDSHAFIYFALISGGCIVFYLMIYNKKKILALMIEGRRRNLKRRPNSAVYSKLDCNLEEAMASTPSTSASNTLLY